MGINLSPEGRMARKIIAKHKLTVPFDLDKLVHTYAKVYYKTIPIEGVDGVCIDLKKPGKSPTVIVNDSTPKTRQKFTLAHELGHIIIPWHLGTIVDDIDEANTGSLKNNQYWKIEAEANRFASELLMPIEFIYKEFQRNPDPEKLIQKIKSQCGVSEMAARIRFQWAISEISEMLMPEDQIKTLFDEFSDIKDIQSVLMRTTPFNSLHIARHMVKYLPGKIAFVVEENNVVKGCGGTEITQINYQFEGQDFQPESYLHYSKYDIHKDKNEKTHWWSLDVKFEIPEDARDWREILNNITNDLDPQEGAQKFKQVINGKLAGLNSQRKEKNRYANFDVFLEEVIHRFNDERYGEIVAHPDFLVFVKKRSEDLFGKK